MVEHERKSGEGEKPLLVVILGPTAVGKSALALRLAQEFQGEIVSADSRQIYRRMDIGTAKPTPEERALVPHHLMDIVDPDEPFTLAQYQEATYKAIRDIQGRGKVPFLVGGTGLYIRAVLEGFLIPQVEPNHNLREKLVRDNDVQALYARLKEVDPQAAAKIDPQNIRRIIRALEVYEKTGKPISRLQQRHPPSFRVLKIGLTMERSRLFQRIDKRVDRMMEAGLLQEVQALLEKGYSPDLPSMSGLGYRELAAYLRREVSLKDAVQRIKYETHRFVREQYKWFRLSDPTIHWFDVEHRGTHDQVRSQVVRFIAGK